MSEKPGPTFFIVATESHSFYPRECTVIASYWARGHLLQLRNSIHIAIKGKERDITHAFVQNADLLPINTLSRNWNVYPTNLYLMMNPGLERRYYTLLKYMIDTDRGGGIFRSRQTALRSVFERVPITTGTMIECLMDHSDFEWAIGSVVCKIKNEGTSPIDFSERQKAILACIFYQFPRVCIDSDDDCIIDHMDWKTTDHVFKKLSNGPWWLYAGPGAEHRQSVETLKRIRDRAFEPGAGTDYLRNVVPADASQHPRASFDTKTWHDVRDMMRASNLSFVLWSEKDNGTWIIVVDTGEG